MSEIIKVAGLDPSLRNTGIALAQFDLATSEWSVDKVDIVQTVPQKSKTVRQNSDDYRAGREMIQGVDKVLREYGVTFCFAELPTGSQSARAQFAFGMTVAIMAGLTPPLIQVQPSEVQIAALGRKGANKSAIIEWAVSKFPNAGWLLYERNGATFKKGELKADNEHMADAVAAIAAGVNTVQFAQAMALAAGMRKVA